jgi:phage/conjugal plasmid C-4 type zinc finger TraR family protein
MDDIDRAQHQEALARDAALAEHRHRNRPEAALLIEGERCCVGCFEPIEARRMKAVPLAVRCMQCQEDFERYQWTGR